MIKHTKDRMGKGRGKASSGFVYKKPSDSKLKERAERTGGRFDSPFKAGFDTFRPKQGDNLIRFLPGTWEDHDHYGYTIWMHKFVGPDNSNYLCPRKMLGKHCPICVAAKEAADAGEKEEAKSLSAAEMMVYWVINRDDEAEQPLLFTMSWIADRDVIALCVNKRSGKVLLIDHPDEGFDLVIKRTGQGIKTRYLYSIDREPSSISDDIDKQDEILEYIMQNQLPDILNFYEGKYLEKVLSGSVDQKDEDEPEEEEDEPAPRKSRRARDEEPEDESEEEEDEPAPRKSRRARDEEPEEDEEEYEPAPRRSRKREVIEEDEEEEEDEPAPRRSRKREVIEEPEEEEEEAPFEEEEEQPRRSRRSRAVEEPEEEEEEEEEDPRPRRRSRR